MTQGKQEVAHVRKRPPFLGRALDQICFAVEDLDAAVDYWPGVNGVAKGPPHPDRPGRDQHGR